MAAARIEECPWDADRPFVVKVKLNTGAELRVACTMREHAEIKRQSLEREFTKMRF